MSSLTTHIIPTERGWAILKEDADVFVVKQDGHWSVKKARDGRASAVLPTRAAAIQRAKELVPCGECNGPRCSPPKFSR